MVSLKTLKTGKGIAVSAPDQGSIKADLMKAQRVVASACRESSKRWQAHESEVSAWENRLFRVRLVTKFTKNEEAKKDLQILIEQANTYHKRYKSLYTAEVDFYQSLQKQLLAIESAVSKFTLMEARMELSEDLRRISGQADNIRDFSSNNEDAEVFRNIEKVIQTALALVEVKEQKGIEQ
jgi:hypothetical protein